MSLRSRHVVRRCIAVTGALAAGAIVVIPARATPAAAEITCGQTITASVTLTADIGPCPGDGIVVGADHIRIDLAGHTISGAVIDETTPPVTTQPTGVRVGTHDHVTVTNGRIVGYTIAAIPRRSVFRTAVQVGGIPFENGRTYKHADAGNHDTLRDLYTDADITIVGNDNTVKRVRAGLEVVGDHNHVASSQTPPNPSCCIDPREYVCPSETELGMYIFGASNVIDHNASCGMFVGWGTNPRDGSHNVIAHNVLTGPLQVEGGGLSPPGRPGKAAAIVDERIRDNTIDTEPFANETIDPGAGIVLFAVSRSIVAHNVVTGDGIVINQLPVHTPQDPIGPVDGNALVANHVSYSRGDGIHVPGPGVFEGTAVKGARHTYLSRNVTDHNGNDGIYNAAKSTRLRHNRADDNLALGIESVVRPKDLGGNRASGNGDPRQCVNVRCT